MNARTLSALLVFLGAQVGCDLTPREPREVTIAGLPSCAFDEARGPNHLTRGLAIEVREPGDDEGGARLGNFTAYDDGAGPDGPPTLRVFDRGELLLRVGACDDAACERVEWLTEQGVEVSDGATPMTVALADPIQASCRY